MVNVDEPLKESSILLHPIRWKILNYLSSVDEPKYIGTIAEDISENRRLVSFHLGTLQEFGYLESEFKVIQEPHSKGKAGRFFKITPKFNDMRTQLSDAISPK